MKLTTVNHYDESKYELIGVVQGMSSRSISLAREFFADIGTIFGGKSNLVNSRYIKAREEAIAELKANAKEAGADLVVGLEIETGTISLNTPVFTFIAMGTALKKKDTPKESTSGGSRKTRRRKLK